MGLRNNYSKFRKHLESGGLSYSIRRGIKYLVFIFKIKISEYKNRGGAQIAKGNIRLFISRLGISICWNGIEITRDAGLNSTINTLGMWTDSSRSLWRVLEKKKDYLKLKIIFKDLPLSQVWSLKIEDGGKINWQAGVEIEEFLHIDQLQIRCMLEASYKNWVSGHQEGEFFKLNGGWQVMYSGSAPASLVGVRFPVKDNFLPAFALEAQDNGARDLLPMVENSPLGTNAHVISFRHINTEGQRDYLPGYYHIFSGWINLFTDNVSLDKKIEIARRSCLEKFTEKKPIDGQSAMVPTVLLANLPWQRQGRCGVRAGSRWPHIKDESEGNYLPFPFFLAYAASLLRKHGIDAFLIDAIAEQMPEDSFIEKVLTVKPDYLVVETSVPSIYDDLAIAKKISELGVSIILCGPNAEIYKTEFLKQHTFIDFVLCGEYEFSLLELILSIQRGIDLSKVNGLLYRSGNAIVQAPMKELPGDINSLPWPCRDSLPMDKYCDLPGGLPSPSAQMLASRGCPFGCSFCLWPQVMYRGSHYRPRDINDVANEMEYLIKKKGFKSIYFDDDTFNIDKKRTLGLCRVIKERGLQNIPWAIMARADLMDQETLIEMKSAGLWAVKYGVESAKQSFLHDCRKSLNLKKASEMIKFTQKLGIKVHLTFCFGFPAETKGSLRETVDYALRLHPYSVQFSILTPFPGTRLFDVLDKRGRILTRDWSKYDGHHSCVFKPDRLSPEELKDAKDRAYMIWEKRMDKKMPRSQKVDGSISVSRALSNLMSGEFLNNYPDIFGVFNGRYAFTGPADVQIDLTNDCNNDCIACWCNSPLLEERKIRPDIKKESLSFDLVKGLIDELSLMGTKKLYFSGGGEPFIYPHIMEVLKYAKDRGFVCHINTNFTLLDKEKITKLVDLKIDSLTVSTWAATAGVYARTHPNKNESDFLKIIENLKFLNKVKKGTPHVTLYNVISNINYKELKEMVLFAKETGSESVEFALVDTMPDKTDKLIMDSQQIKELQGIAYDISRKADKNNYYEGVLISAFDRFLKRISSPYDLASATYDRNIIDKTPCYIGWCFSRIMANGDVNACLKAHRIPTGNLHNATFRQIWNGKNQRYFRKKTLACAKSGHFFRLIGNDPGTKEAGCYKSCDDIDRNISIHRRIMSLSAHERKIAKFFARLYFVKKQ